jgi:hypothetical protein
MDPNAAAVGGASELECAQPVLGEREEVGIGRDEGHKGHLCRAVARMCLIADMDGTLLGGEDARAD